MKRSKRPQGHTVKARTFPQSGVTAQGNVTRVEQKTMKKKSKRGGLRNPPGGRPPLEIKREKHSPTLAPGTKELAQAIANKEGWPGWGYAVDEGIKLLAAKLGRTLG